MFGARPLRRDTIDTPPRGVKWRLVKPRRTQDPVRAWRAESDCELRTEAGNMRARGGADYVVATRDNSRVIVRGDIFERSYEPLGGGLYRKRDDIVLRALTLTRPAIVHTLEGPQEAQAGDWLMLGIAGEIWPVPAAEAREKYDPA